jgi:hypothetical protein
MNLTLTQTKRKPEELLSILQKNKAKADKKPFEPRYLRGEEMDLHMAHIHDGEYRRLATDEDRRACLEIARGFTYTIPHVDRHLMLLRRVTVDDRVLARHYGEVWHRAPEAWRNHLRRGAERYMRYCRKSSGELEAFVNRQAGHLNDLSDEQAELVMDLESTEIEVRLSTEPGYYIEPAPKEDRYRMTPKQVSRYLIQQSKGMIYYDAIEISRKLREFGFEQSPHCTAFYVKIK